ncbi:MAG: DUF433 domain-containing protein [Anaerolineae bacterium]|nr:DUF433 domain-containing protein [Anaerolineae bacterium]
MSVAEIIPINLIQRKAGKRLYRIRDKGITVAFLVDYIDDPEWPVERICQAYGLTPAEVYAAWAFYYEHRAEIDEQIQRAEEFYESLPDIRQHLEGKRAARDFEDT